MKPWTLPPMLLDEHERLRRLIGLGIGQERHDFLDTITALAASTLKCPIALVSLVEEERQFFASRHGLESTSTGRDVSFCAHCIADQTPLIVENAVADPRFAQNPLVVGDPSIRSYLGFPLFGGAGQSALGTFCVIDQEVRVWTDEEKEFVGRLASMVEAYLEGLVYVRVWDASPLAFVVLDAAGLCVRANAAFGRLVGRSVASVVDQPLSSCVLSSDRSVLHAMVVSATTSRDIPTRRSLRYVRLTGEVVSGGTSMSPLGNAEGYAICVIRDISLESRQSSVNQVASQVRQELKEPLARARDLLAVARVDSASATQHFDDMARILDEVDELVDARIGDLSARTRMESELVASEQRLRSVAEHIIGPMLVIDDRGRIVDCNHRALAALGWQYDDLVGRSVSTVMPSFNEEVCRSWFDICRREALVSDTTHEVRTLVSSGGGELVVQLSLMVMYWNGPDRLVLIAHDVTKAMQQQVGLVHERDALETKLKSGALHLSRMEEIEAGLTTSLHEKETLLKEIHHRVKNNLQMVSSLLSLQMQQIPDGLPRELLAESVRRVRSMAMIHQHLYGSTSLGHVDLGGYVRTLADALRLSIAPSAILHIDSPSTHIAVDQAMPVCLILNELLTNAFKHGFLLRADASSSRQPYDWHVSAVLTQIGRQIRLEVRDRGVGLPADFKLQGHDSLGLQLVTSLTRQIRGKASARNDDGAVFIIEFETGQTH